MSKKAVAAQGSNNKKPANDEMRTKKRSFAEAPPPPGVPEGGTWGTQRYRGLENYCMCILFGPFGLLCWPCTCSQRQAYQHNGVLYDLDGKRLRKQKGFVESKTLSKTK